MRFDSRQITFTLAILAFLFIFNLGCNDSPDPEPEHIINFDPTIVIEMPEGEPDPEPTPEPEPEPEMSDEVLFVRYITALHAADWGSIWPGQQGNFGTFGFSSVYGGEITVHGVQLTVFGDSAGGGYAFSAGGHADATVQDHVESCHMTNWPSFEPELEPVAPDADGRVSLSEPFTASEGVYRNMDVNCRFTDQDPTTFSDPFFTVDILTEAHITAFDSEGRRVPIMLESGNFVDYTAIIALQLHPMPEAGEAEVVFSSGLLPGQSWYDGNLRTAGQDSGFTAISVLYEDEGTLIADAFQFEFESYPAGYTAGDYIDNCDLYQITDNGFGPDSTFAENQPVVGNSITFASWLANDIWTTVRLHCYFGNNTPPEIVGFSSSFEMVNPRLWESNEPITVIDNTGSPDLIVYRANY